MSEDNNNAANLINNLKANPKVLYGTLGAIVVGALAMALGGGGDGQVHVKTAVSSGQSVTLENPNGGNSHVTTIPGLLSASDAEEDKEKSVCVAKSGTKATVEEEQIVGQLPFVKVKVTEGECEGKSGWTSKVNVKGG
jgi:hypothetical protein